MDLKTWKEKKRKTFQLKTGLDVTVRELSPFALAELGPIPRLEDASEDNQLLAAKRICQAGVISPKLGTGDNELDLADLSMEDINEIVDAVAGFSKRPDELPLGDGSLEGQTQS